MPSSIGSVEFSMKKSAECSTKPRPVSTGPPLSTFTVAGCGRQLDPLGGRNDFKLHQQIGKFDIGAGWLTTMPIAPSVEWAQT